MLPKPACVYVIVLKQLTLYREAFSISIRRLLSRQAKGTRIEFDRQRLYTALLYSRINAQRR